jgi:formylglycine-generating enzyme required for sulfatase activity
MKRLIGFAVLALFFSANIFAQGSVDGFVAVMDELKEYRGVKIPADVQKKSFEFVPIVKKGEKVTFKMGSTSGYGDEKPVHDVTLTKPFEMQKTEVTQLQYEIVMGTNPSYFQKKGETYNRPVEKVSYNDAQNFIAELNNLDTKYTYRLPTEAEWEYAAGEDPAPLGDYAWYSDNSGRRTHDVASKDPNKFGLYDMLGNVWEWVSDFYDGEYYSSLDSFVDPKGPDTGSRRVVRGGSWNCAGYCRSAFRGYGSFDPDFGGGSMGFRLVRTAK